MPDRIAMTQEGYDKIVREKEELQRRVPSIKQQIQEAREKGDLRENADYHAAREELGMVQGKIQELEGMIALADILDMSKAPEGKAVMGRTVKFKRLSDGQVMQRTLVGAGQADAASGKILCNSPIGKALVGAEVGDVVKAVLPAGEMQLEILSIE